LLVDAGIVRNPAKVELANASAPAAAVVRQEGGSLRGLSEAIGHSAAAF
jgi:3-methyladenine DNA glycosylase Tag